MARSIATDSVLSTVILVPAFIPSTSFSATAVPLPRGDDSRIIFFASSSEIFSSLSAGRLSILLKVFSNLYSQRTPALSYIFQIFGYLSLPEPGASATPRLDMIHTTTQIR